MARALEKQPSCALHGPRAAVPTRLLVARWIGQAYRYAVVVLREARFRELKFQFGEDVGCGQDGLSVLSDLARHLEENAMDLRLFFIQQTDEFVVLLDRFEGLDEDCLSAGTCAVDDALYLNGLPNVVDLLTSGMLVAVVKYGAQIWLRNAKMPRLRLLLALVWGALCLRSERGSAKPCA